MRHSLLTVSCIRCAAQRSIHKKFPLHLSAAGYSLLVFTLVTWSYHRFCLICFFRMFCGILAFVFPKYSGRDETDFIIGKHSVFVKRQLRILRLFLSQNRLFFPYKCLYFSFFPKARSLITSPAKIKPATDGTKAMLAGAIRPAVPFFSRSKRFPSSSYSLEGTVSSLE